MQGQTIQNKYKLLSQGIPMSREQVMSSDPMYTAAATAVQDNGWKKDLVNFIKEQEEFRPTMYHDPSGGYAIGYGHIIQPGEEFRRPLTEPHAEGLLNEDLDPRIEHTATYWDKHHSTPFTELPSDAKAILVDFVYNLGVTGLDRYPKLRKAIDQGDWKKIKQ